MEERERDALEAEAEARGVRRRSPPASRDAVGRGEVVLVVVERRDRGRLVDRRSGTRTSNLSSCSRWLAASIRPLRPKNGSRGDVEVGVEPEAAQQRDRAVAPACRATRCTVSGSPIRTISRMVEHLQPRRVARRLVAEDVGAAGVDRHAARPRSGPRAAIAG